MPPVQKCPLTPYFDKYRIVPTMDREEWLKSQQEMAAIEVRLAAELDDARERYEGSIKWR